MHFFALQSSLIQLKLSSIVPHLIQTPNTRGVIKCYIFSHFLSFLPVNNFDLSEIHDMSLFDSHGVVLHHIYHGR